MRRLLKLTLVLAIIGGMGFGGYALYTSLFAKQSPTISEQSKSVSTLPHQKRAVSDPTQHDVFDVEFAKKLVLYHELAAQLDSYAKVNATQPAVKEFASKKSIYNAEQAKIYASLLDSWGAKYSNIEDFPKVAGGGCSGYPTFPGMLPHKDVNAYLQTTAQDVDKQYLILMTKHHDGINLIIQQGKPLVLLV